MGRKLRRGWHWIVWIVTFTRVDLGANDPPDFTEDKKKLDGDHATCKTDLSTIQTETVRLQGELDKLIAEVKKCGAEGKKTPNKILCEIRLLRGQISINEARETVLARKIEQITAHLGMIALYGDAQPVAVRDEVRRISDRIKVRVDTIAVDTDEVHEGKDGVHEAVAISDLAAELRDIESEILGHNPQQVRDKDLLAEAAEVAGHASDKAKTAATPEPGYDVVEEDGYAQGEEDEEESDDDPPQSEPPARQLDFS